MKVFKIVVIFLIAIAAAGGIWVRESPYWSLYWLDRALDERDVIEAERFVDLEAFARSGAQAVGAVSRDVVGIEGGDTGSKILGALVGVVTEGVGNAIAPDVARSMRESIKAGTLRRGIGAFVVHPGAAAVGDVGDALSGYSRVGDTGLITIHGGCDGTQAQIRIVLDRRPGLLFGYPSRWVLVGVDDVSAKALVATCGAKKMGDALR